MQEQSWLNTVLNWAKHIDEKLDKSQPEMFSKFAFEELSSINWSEGFQVKEFVYDFCEQEVIPKQFAVHSNFGHPPFTLFNSSKHNFIVELYIWEDYHTGIHDHSFAGAFQVISGQSLESTYEFQDKQKINDDCNYGNLVKKNLSLLKLGDTKEIILGESYIHRVIHICPTTVTLILRTKEKDESEQSQSMIQRSYFFNRLSSRCFPADDIIIRLRAFEWMLKKGEVPKRSLLGPIINYERFWTIFSSYPEHREKLIKLTRIIFDNVELGDIFANSQLLTILKQVDSVEDKILLVSYEFLGLKKWPEWTQANLNLNFEQSSQKLIAALRETKQYQDKSITHFTFLKDLKLEV